jgi:serine/threonine protein kinase
LKQEARATGIIESENIVQVLDAGEDPSAGLFVVMELLRGENLESLLERQRKLPPAAAAMIAIQAARGLARAHARGIVHRDLKPANIVLCEREDKTPLVKLVDFGIAKLLRDAPSAKLTRSGNVVGTPQYMAPEQAQGLETVDARSDIYALGTVLYEMLLGVPAVPELANYEQMLIHLVTQPSPRARDVEPELDERLDALLADMMAKNQADRPTDMETVIERLSELFTRDEVTPASYTGVGLCPDIRMSLPPPRRSDHAVVVEPITVVAPKPSSWLWMAGATLIVALAVAFTGLRSPPHPVVHAELPPPAEVLPIAAPPIAEPVVVPSAAPSIKPPPVPRPTLPPPPKKPHVFGGAGLSTEF